MTNGETKWRGGASLWVRAQTGEKYLRHIILWVANANHITEFKAAPCYISCGQKNVIFSFPGHQIQMLWLWWQLFFLTAAKTDIAIEKTQNAVMWPLSKTKLIAFILTLVTALILVPQHHKQLQGRLRKGVITRRNQTMTQTIMRTD